MILILMDMKKIYTSLQTSYTMELTMCLCVNELYSDYQLLCFSVMLKGLPTHTQMKCDSYVSDTKLI